MILATMETNELKMMVRIELTRRHITQAKVAKSLGYDRKMFNHALRFNGRASPKYQEMLERTWVYLLAATPTP